MQIIRLLVQKTHVCLPIDYVSKILPLMLLEAVPKSPVYLIGLMNLAGKSIPVVDLAVRLGFNRKQAYTLDTPILLCKSAGQELAFLVDHILGLADLDPGALQGKSDFSKEQAVFSGSIPIENQLFLFLNMPLLIENAEYAYENE